MVTWDIRRTSLALSFAVLGLGACSDDGTPTTSSADSTGASTGSQTTTTSPTTTDPTATDGSATDGSATGSSGTSPTSTDPTEGSTAANPACGDGAVDDGEECDDGNADDADACTNACKNAVCGDAIVLVGVEECDDGNADDADACTNACTNAACGDGIVGPGEACDDGNQVDDDACSNACASANCGDGKVQVGEECDDGNADDTDACLGTCLAAKCGDMAVQAGVEECDDGNSEDTDACTSACKNAVCGDSFVQAGVEECDDGNAEDTDACVTGCKAAKCGDGFAQMGVEECDDGNMSEADMCTTMCKTPTCMDMAKNGTETDVDCGGACMSKCALGKACTVGGDCGTGFCSMNLCAVAPSCKAIKQANPMAANGVYQIDPDGNGPVMPFNAFCEMTIDGGGWTLALKADGSKTTFAYDAALWTNASTFQPNFPDLDRNEAKLQTFMSVAFTDILIGLESPIANMGPLNLKTQKITITRPSLQNLFMGNVYTATTLGRNAWKALITNSSLQLNCNREGFNSNPAGSTRSRIGIVSNQENDCNSPDSYIGIGNTGAGCNAVPETRVGNMASCTPDNGDKSLSAFGVVFVR